MKIIFGLRDLISKQEKKKKEKKNEESEYER